VRCWAALLALLFVGARAAASLPIDTGELAADGLDALEVAQLGEGVGLKEAADPEEDALAALPQVPDDIECYHELVEKVKEITNRLADEKDHMHTESVKFNHTSEVKETSLHKVQKLETDIVKLRAAMDESKEAYKKEHLAALSTYELARSSLNKYNDFKKKAEDETTRSQEDMAAYLKYKELALTATEDGDDANVARYQRMSDKYLESYQGLETSIKTHLKNAKDANQQYQALSTQYEEAGKEVKALEVTAEQNTKSYESTNTELEHQKAVYDQAVQDSAAAQESYEEMANKVKLSTQELEDGHTEVIVTNRKFHDADKKLKALEDESNSATAKMSKYREISFQLETKAKNLGEEATKQEALADQYAEKWGAATKASKAFSDGYELGGCGILPHQLAAKKARKAEVHKAKQAAGMAVQLAMDELSAADKIRKAATTAATKESTAADELLGEGDAPEYKVRFEEFVNQFHTHNRESFAAEDPKVKEHHRIHAAAAHRGMIVLLQQDSEEKDDQCEQMKETATTNLHAMEEAGMQKDHHTAAGKLARKKQQSNLSGVTSTAVILKNLETRVANLKAEVKAVTEKRQHPCVTPPSKK